MTVNMQWCFTEQPEFVRKLWDITGAEAQSHTASQNHPEVTSWLLPVFWLHGSKCVQQGTDTSREVLRRQSLCGSVLAGVLAEQTLLVDATHGAPI